MKAKELREKSVKELNRKLLSLLGEQFDLRMKISSGQISQTHHLKDVRRHIARIKTLITEKVSKNG